MLRKWLKSGYLEGSLFHDTVSGTPQGGVISPVLANLVLDGLEEQLRLRFPRCGSGCMRGKAAQVHLVRYADDCAPRRCDGPSTGFGPERHAA